MGKLILIMGLPYSGKTTYASSLTGMKITVDELRKSVTGSYSTLNNNNELVRHLVARSVHHYLTNDKTVIVDDYFLSKKRRMSFIKLARQTNSEVELFWIDTPLPLITARMKDRNVHHHEKWKEQPPNINQFSSLLEIPTREEGFDYIYYINEGL